MNRSKACCGTAEFDITERKRMEDNSPFGEQEFRALAENRRTRFLAISTVVSVPISTLVCQTRRQACERNAGRDAR